MSGRVLIVNADDFGRSPGVNSGIIRAHEEGIVTSATLMVRWPDAEEAAVYARRTSLAVGLHLDLGEWEYAQGEWRARYEVVDTETAEAVAEELERQLGRFERLMGGPPTHLDSHQHVHRDEPVRTELLRAGGLLGVPVRHYTPGIAYSGAFFGHDGRATSLPEAITVEALVRVIEGLPPGVTELSCHPAAEVDHESSYAHERLREMETLCDPRVRAAVRRRDVALRSFADFRVDAGRAMSQENMDIVRRCYESWRRRDFPALLALVESDAVLDLSRNVFNPDVYRGHAGFRRWVDATGEVWDELQFTALEFVGEVGNQIVTAVRLSGTGRGSGAEAEMEVCQVWELRGGKVVRLTGGYRDRAEALEAVAVSDH